MGGWTAHLLLALLAPCAGMFVAASGLLPSSFAMCCLTAGAAAVLAGQPLRVVAAGAAGLVWGWPVAGAEAQEHAILVWINFGLIKNCLVKMFDVVRERVMQVCPMIHDPTQLTQPQSPAAANDLGLIILSAVLVLPHQC